MRRCICRTQWNWKENWKKVAGECLHNQITLLMERYLEKKVERRVRKETGNGAWRSQGKEK